MGLVEFAADLVFFFKSLRAVRCRMDERDEAKGKAWLEEAKLLNLKIE